jgi:hypothetical protein
LVWMAARLVWMAARPRSCGLGSRDSGGCRLAPRGGVEGNPVPASRVELEFPVSRPCFSPFSSLSCLLPGRSRRTRAESPQTQSFLRGIWLRKARESTGGTRRLVSSPASGDAIGGSNFLAPTFRDDKQFVGQMQTNLKVESLSEWRATLQRRGSGLDA